MAITNISRDWGTDPSIVRITTTDNLAVITAVDYLEDQATNIEALNNGAFEWLDSDIVAIDYDGGKNFFNRDAANQTFIYKPTMQYKAVTLTAAEFNGMYAAPVELVSAGGANTLHVVSRAVLEFDYGGAQFANGGVVAVQYSDTINGAGVDATVDIAAATINGISADSVVMTEGELPVATAANTVNEGLFLSNETGAFDTGTSNVTVHIWYSTIPTTF